MKGSCRLDYDDASIDKYLPTFRGACVPRLKSLSILFFLDYLNPEYGGEKLGNVCVYQSTITSFPSRLGSSSTNL